MKYDWSGMKYWQNGLFVLGSANCFFYFFGGRGRIASSADDNCHFHNLLAIYDICFSLAAGRNASQAPIFVEMMQHQTANCRKEAKN